MQFGPGQRVLLSSSFGRRNIFRLLLFCLLYVCQMSQFQVRLIRRYAAPSFDT